MKRSFVLILFLALSLAKCSEREPTKAVVEDLTIFFINDQHGQIDNFAKLKHIVDKQREVGKVILACSGDIFSGNPVVDNHPEKGYPMIDLMNKVGFDVSTLGNHEFDYGEIALYDRMDQAQFDWVCANVDMGKTGIPQPDAYQTIDLGDLKITFLGLVETNGKENGTIPSTHPWKVQNFVFSRAEDIVGQYKDLKSQEDADLLVALTHLGHDGGSRHLGDYQLARDYPFFDLIIGGHSHHKTNMIINDIPIFQAGSYLNHLGKISITFDEDGVDQIDFQLIDLNNYPEFDQGINDIVAEYNEAPHLEEVIGTSSLSHAAKQAGCFYADALRIGMKVDLAFQNIGGIRSGIDEGDITVRDIYELDPFNNGSVIYQLTVGQIRTFLEETGSTFYYSGVEIVQDGTMINLYDMDGDLLADSHVLTVGINDYIPAVHDEFFPEDGVIQDYTTAEILIDYLKTESNPVNYPACDNIFRYER